MTQKLPITLEEFKSYFCQDKGFEFQPYKTWEKTVFDTGDFALLNNVFYVSTKDLNIASPDQEESGFDKLSHLYEEGKTFEVGSVVYHKGFFFKALKTNSNEPQKGEDWDVLSDKDLSLLYPNYRLWAEPVAYSTNDRVIAMVNYKLGVYVSNVEGNYYSPSKPLIEANPYPVEAWELDENQEVDWILDTDILKAMGEAAFKFNAGLVPNEEKRKIIALYLTAFFVAYDRQMANSGLNSSSSSGPVRSRTVGKMSVSYMESKLFEKHPSYEFFARNQYGIKAFNLLLPYLRGNVIVLNGRPTAE